MSKSTPITVVSIDETANEKYVKVGFRQEVRRQRQLDPMAGFAALAAFTQAQTIQDSQVRMAWKLMLTSEVVSLSLRIGSDYQAILLEDGKKGHLLEIQSTLLTPLGDDYAQLIKADGSIEFPGFGGLDKANKVNTTPLTIRANGRDFLDDQYALTDNGKLIFSKNLLLVMPLDFAVPADLRLEDGRPFERKERLTMPALSANLQLDLGNKEELTRLYYTLNLKANPMLSDTTQGALVTN